jgi:hypothetical protein
MINESWLEHPVTDYFTKSQIGYSTGLFLRDAVFLTPPFALLAAIAGCILLIVVLTIVLTIVVRRNECSRAENQLAADLISKKSKK